MRNSGRGLTDVSCSRSRTCNSRAAWMRGAQQPLVRLRNAGEDVAFPLVQLGLHAGLVRERSASRRERR